MTHYFGRDLISALQAGHGFCDHSQDGRVGGVAHEGGAVVTGAGQVWELTLPASRAIRFVVIENATPVDRPDAPIEADIRDPDGNWLRVHAGLCSFGDQETGLPLVIDLGPGRRFSGVRLTGDAGLRLASVRLIGPAAPNPDFRFVATRLDGLCQRLTTLLNAVILADLTGRDFGFIWYAADLPEVDGQANSDLGLLFEPDFVERHLVDLHALHRGMPHYYNRPYSEAEFDWLMKEAEDHGVFQVDRPGRVEQIFPQFADRIDRFTNARAFDSLGFTATARAAIDEALGHPLPEGAVGLHLRGGDIVHGTHSNHGGYLHKAVSIFEVEALAEQTKTAGTPLVIVGQEHDLIDLMVARYDHVSGVHHHTSTRGFDPVQGVLFDAIILSRMARIWAPLSAVSRLSMKLGDVPLTDMGKLSLLPDPGLFRDKPFDDTDYSGISANYRAYSAIKSVWMQPVERWGAGHLAALQYANRVRPGVQFIHLLLGAVRARMGRWDIAEDRIRSTLTLPPPFEETDVTTSYLLSTDPPAPEAVIGCFAGADPVAHPHVHFLFQLCRAFHLRDPEARAHVRRVIAGETAIQLRPELIADIEQLVFGKRNRDLPGDQIAWLR
ncbi:hypothetical protein JQU17_05760 [Ponticoccus sp. SC2-23]|uniref:hypothetical protein n=1 Tax=Alexandriicola marinus TaxID=2081710 RepID=UPI000FD75E26|nr:hypothetical protein [Alexandriicola marinus]MBM1219696.1 hypothetical protein [Ponticoccus sp. SC6-9]MBM1223232.1 hypothetical protein [Ponticoccus sp. SC6-15]MBM1229509.1 hypothetical protein [Ponticoccus sp. SC6-38]MBM1232198.1 hypothetical protein [Ponticoccus sp. SC6-45]MBM1237852.1 hypothetical protein [Ponticoccus sp. SC6-49]MBM1241209.1 hypothetical protein [Ponticoccus sp. SC2-64]MBM1245722.1 hypothetical protein [Ponticoccus sp. SC6-42]MBM1250200.1 hypothetical protein [Pontico